MIEPLVAQFGAKQPKVASGCGHIATSLIEGFGPKVVPAKPLLKVSPLCYRQNSCNQASISHERLPSFQNLKLLFASPNKDVRETAQGLAVALYKFIGPSVQAGLKDLKPVQVGKRASAFDASALAQFVLPRFFALF